MAAASRICNGCCGLYADGFGDLDVNRGEPVVAVGAGAVDDAEELVVQRLGDRAHGAVADQDAVDRAKVGDLGGGAGKEGLVADVDHLAQQRLLDDFYPELLRQRENGVAGDAVEYRVRQWRGIEDAAADEEEVFAGALGEVAVGVEPDALGVAVDLGLHADELRVHVVGAGLGERRHGVGGEAGPAGDTDVGALVAVDVFAPGEVGDVDLDRALQWIDAHLAVAAESDGADVAGRDSVGFDDIDDGSSELVCGIGQGHAVDFGGVDETSHVFGEAEDAGACFICAAGALGVAANALEDRRAVVDDVGHDMNLRLIPGDELSVVPDVGGGLYGHSCAPKALRLIIASQPVGGLASQLTRG